VYNNLGNVYLARGEWLNARAYYEKAFQIRQKKLGDDHLKTAQSRLNLGNIFASLHQADSALLFFEEALPAYLDHYGRQHPKLAALYENMGNAMIAQQQFIPAANLLEEALAIRKNYYGEAHPDLIRSYQNMGELWLQRGDYQQAQQYFQYALDLSLRLWGEYHPQIAQAYEQLGLALLYQDETAEAKNKFEQTIALRQSLFGPDHPFVAGSWLNLGNANWQAGAYEQAREYYQKSLSIWANHPDNWPIEQTKASLNISQTYTEEGLPEQARLSLAQTVTYLDTALITLNSSYLRTKAAIFQQLKEYAQADRLLTKALEQLGYQRLKNNRQEEIPTMAFLLCLQNKGTNLLAWAKATDDPQLAQTALNLLEEAIDWLMVLQTTYASPEARQQMSALHQPLFENAIAACIYLAEKNTQQHDYHQQALVLSERNKSIKLLEADFLHNHSQNRLPDTLLQSWQQTSLHLHQLEKKLALDQQELSTAELQNTKAQLFHWQQQRNILEKEVKRYEGKSSLSSLYLTKDKIAELQEQLSDRETILSFFIGEEQYYLFLLQQQTLRVYTLADTFAWNASIRELGKSIIQFATASSSERKQVDRIYTYKAQEIYQQLLAPIQAVLPSQGHLLIIPDGIFNYLPFEALLTSVPEQAMRYRSYPYLIHEHTISYTYSISQWLNDQQKLTLAASPDRACLAVAPHFNGAATSLAPLEHNLSEAQAVLQQFQGKLLADSAATRQNFLAEAGTYAIIHLATHALTNIQDGDYAYFVLAADRIQAPDPYSRLYVKDLYAQQWEAQLAVLSACETGVGSFKAGEGVISLGRGFAQAGVKSTVSSLWQINDTQTALLMEQFYQALKADQRKDDALRQAKIALLSQSSHELAHPFYWASYLPYGDMSPLKVKARAWYWWVVGILLAGTFMFVFCQRS
ncbi:MAG: CHAT domain-containing protein, partial [Bacteroidota bacterium]